MSRCELVIALDRPDDVFLPGEPVSGRVEVRVDGPCATRGLTLTREWRTHGRGNRARGRCHAAEFDGLGAERFRQRLDIVERDLAQDSFPDGRLTSFRRELSVKPEAPLFIEEPVELLAVVFVKLRSESGFERVKAQQGCGEAVDCADVAPFDIPERIMHPAVDFVFRQAVVSKQRFDFAGKLERGATRGLPIEPKGQVGLQPFAQSKLHLVCGLVGKSQRDDLGDPERIGVAQKQVHQPINQESGLARSGACGDNDVAAERGDGPLALIAIAKLDLVRLPAHGSLGSLAWMSRCIRVTGSFSARHRLGG